MKHPSARSCLLAWAALLALLGASAGTSLLSLGKLNMALNFTIAAAKAGLVLFVFMHLGSQRRVVQFAAAAGLLWLGVLVTLSLGDFLTRNL